jgi:hypothetical protein
MSYRNLSPHEMFYNWAREHKPECEFAGSTTADFARWKEQVYPRVIATLGDFPERVPLNPEMTAEWEHGDLIKQRWLIDVGKHISAALILCRHKSLGANEKRPTILCWHGHGQFGKDSVMGIDSTPERRAEIINHNYDYGRQMAEAGFVTFAIDWIGIGERSDIQKPHFKSMAGGRDWCNLYYLCATMLGTTSIAINVTHGICATDFVCSQPNVDPDRLGVMGLSGGGTMALWSALCDPRFKAVEIICYSDLWANFGFRSLNYCGMQVAPGLFKLVDLPDLQGLLAPKPLPVDIGAYDTCFTIDEALACYRRVEHIYSIAGARDRLELDLFAAEHSWGGNKSIAFFTKYL